MALVECGVRKCSWEPIEGFPFSDTALKDSLSWELLGTRSKIIKLEMLFKIFHVIIKIGKKATFYLPISCLTKMIHKVSAEQTFTNSSFFD